MKEAIGNSFIFNLVIIFVVIVMLLVVGSLSYSKAFKVKNNIINTIEKNSGYNQTTVDEIEAKLQEIGYRVNTSNIQNCPARDNCSVINADSDYRYCVYKCDTEKGFYFRVTSYMYFDVPIVDRLIEIPVSGESKTFYNF